MSRTYLSKELRRKVAEQAQYRCGYCLTAEVLIGSQMDVEHIVAEAAGGSSDESNLWLCCPKCNSHKSDKISALDPETKQSTSLFNPRTQVWSEHFEWSEAGELIIGKTAVGRASVEALQLNRPHLISSRQLWMA